MMDWISVVSLETTDAMLTSITVEGGQGSQLWHQSRNANEAAIVGPWVKCINDHGEFTEVTTSTKIYIQP